MFKTLGEMMESLRRIRLVTEVKVVQAGSHPLAVIREEGGTNPDDDVVPGGQNFKGEDGKRGTV